MSDTPSPLLSRLVTATTYQSLPKNCIWWIHRPVPASRTCTTAWPFAFLNNTATSGDPSPDRSPIPATPIALAPTARNSVPGKPSVLILFFGHAVLDDDLGRPVGERKQAGQLGLAVAVAVLEHREVAILTCRIHRELHPVHAAIIRGGP